ncbi:hypothetical protein [Mycobacterium szulgai]|uniref:hypothetical protein n=1 Tax=Mycobacterium szulgai TaxID=1787 RepID=UPI0021F3B316|nr:hypothetical protein [Mycobacterium szulgai]MCV7078017.1 hypothetical protein [Mycobacterium szulgai]
MLGDGGAGGDSTWNSGGDGGNARLIGDGGTGGDPPPPAGAVVVAAPRAGCSATVVTEGPVGSGTRSDITGNSAGAPVPRAATPSDYSAPAEPAVTAGTARVDPADSAGRAGPPG